MLTIPYTTVYCPPMTYNDIITQKTKNVKNKKESTKVYSLILVLLRLYVGLPARLSFQAPLPHSSGNGKDVSLHHEAQTPAAPPQPR